MSGASSSVAANDTVPAGATPSSTNGGLVTPGNKPVTVSLHVAIDLNANVELFAYPGDTAVNPLTCNTGMSAATLTGLFQYVETGPSGEQITGSRVDAKVDAVAANFQSAAGSPSAAANNIAAVDVFTPVFGPYIGQVDANGKPYSTFPSVGHLALSWAANEIFGHVGATAAIDNDSTVISSINGSLATKLAAALRAIPQGDLDLIAASVIGQDSSRGGQYLDNSVSNNTPRDLLFRAGDVIHIRVNLKDFTASNANSNQTVDAVNYGIESSAQSYDLVITLAGSA